MNRIRVFTALLLSVVVLAANESWCRQRSSDVVAGVGATLAGSSQAFTWTAGEGASSYWLYVGTAVGANNLFNREVGSSLTATVTGLPTDSRTVYVRLWWLAGGWWSFADYTYTTPNAGGGGGGLNPAITTASAAATLTGSSQTFTWIAGSGATSSWLYLGNAVGGYDLFNQSMGLSLTASVSGLPTDGRRIYARLWWVRSGEWEYADTTYTAASNSSGNSNTNTNPAITTPAASSTLSGSSQTFAWTAGTGTSSSWLYLGSSAGGHDLFDQSLGSSLSATAGGLPTDGRTIHARLWWARGGAWEYADSWSTAAGTILRRRRWRRGRELVRRARRNREWQFRRAFRPHPGRARGGAARRSHQHPIGHLQREHEHGAKRKQRSAYYARCGGRSRHRARDRVRSRPHGQPQLLRRRRAGPRRPVWCRRPGAPGRKCALLRTPQFGAASIESRPHRHGVGAGCHDLREPPASRTESDERGQRCAWHRGRRGDGSHRPRQRDPHVFRRRAAGGSRTRRPRLEPCHGRAHAHLARPASRGRERLRRGHRAGRERHRHESQRQLSAIDDRAS